ncbi:hypothetical protein KR51_00029550 [Rubidibacter lacunae KORDI 51-2]|uniref:DUF218 domain-containing protein n=1 Tax=Rubidibacter lacunae KORDI 51-2 TaxID=582515 RepID=U5DL15_9CHRO|nr:YdcF family protein [Rubidibacter lacunae]ERN40415.1 hypothetical protein KR51_00029550 [Rubidibacter lacunae KORDI 51-2]
MKRYLKRYHLVLFVALVLAIAGWRCRSVMLVPKAVLVLGGAEERERYAAQLAKQYPELPVWVSSGSPAWYAELIFSNAGVARDRLHLDYRAVDTVTNFTTLVGDLQASGVDSVYLVTSKHHMPRARLVGEIVLGSRGIAVKPIVVPSVNPPAEPPPKTLRDTGRALFWLTTGRTCAAGDVHHTSTSNPSGGHCQLNGVLQKIDTNYRGEASDR